jgi:hypothetical protein
MNGTIVVCAALALGVSNTQAALHTINWLDMSPTPFGSSVPNNSVFNLPGVGNVTVTYSIPSSFTDARFQNPLLLNGNVTSGPDTYNWTGHELFAATNNQPADPVVGVPWRITYTFPGTLPAGTIYLGVSGLGQTTSFGGGASIATVNQNGTFLGDWGGGGNYGPTQFTAGPPFTMQNSLTGAGGADPWWNTPLGVVRIDDAINSLTIDFAHIAGDGVGVNIGTTLPEPASLAFIALGGIRLLRGRKPRN